MGVDIGSKFLIGLYPSDFTEEMLTEINELFDGGKVEWAEHVGLSYASPWFDSPTDYYFFGYEIDAVDPKHVIDEILSKGKDWLINFKCNPVIYAGPNVY